MTTSGLGGTGQPRVQVRADLHCHSRASFDGVADPAALVAMAATRGLTHVAITDHDTLDGAFRAAEAAPAGITVLIGCEVTTRDGDLILIHLQTPIPRGLSAREAIDAGREQGALIGIPHPYDHRRRSLLLDPEHEELLARVDWVETWNARVTDGAASVQAMAVARRAGLPGVGVSDAHTLLEVGMAFTTMTGDPSTPAGLLAALRGEVGIEGPSGLDATTPPGRQWPRLRGRAGSRSRETAR